MPIDREVARVYIERREFPVPDVLEATRKFAQPELLVADEAPASNVAFGADAEPETSTIITPFPRMNS
ncbi:hypothetical protein [Streptomyces agglomeratus]|uniref:hypothetical protein n=1 Tax=Streptomyces agglomeratus TaxID=285458 RepID=UPI00085405CE|nr:hypothetical protein [Streptomyces agglomeratus]OEJ36518.1 hypothetical protein BGK72_38110 [Streptomyces agglomeratus]